MDIKTKEQWDLLEKSLVEIDDELSSIAQEKNLTIDKNYHNWPSRSLMWKTGDRLDRKLEIVLETNLKTFLIYGYAWHDDESGRRFVKILNLMKGIQAPLKSILREVIIKNMDLINRIKKEELKESI